MEALDRFEQALAAVLGQEKQRTGIGTLREKTLHAVLKRYIEPYTENHEVRVGPYVADIVGEEGVVEIQTRNFDRLRTKLGALLEVACVTVVYPIPHTKWLRWLDPATGEATERRKSPKHGCFAEAAHELYKIRALLSHPNLRVRLILLDMEEYRLLDGWNENRKRGSTRYERVPTALVDELVLECPVDYRKLLPEGLPTQFHSRDVAACGHIRLATAQKALNVLGALGAVYRAGKCGRLNLYSMEDLARDTTRMMTGKERIL